MSNYPVSLPPVGSANSSDTLAAAGHTALHNNGANETRAVATKVGTGSSTPAPATVLHGGATPGTSLWGAVDLANDVTGILATARGGTGTTSTTGSGSVVYSNSPTIVSPTITGGGLWDNPTLTQPTITDFSNAEHDHSSASEGGQLTSSALTNDSSWAWQSWTPTLTNCSGTVTFARYTQMGKIVHFRILVIMTSVSGVIRFSLPVGLHDDYNSNNLPINATVWMVDSGVNNYSGFVRRAAQDTLDIYTSNSSGTYVSVATATSSLIPFTWGASDSFTVVGSYEAA